MRTAMAERTFERVTTKKETEPPTDRTNERMTESENKNERSLCECLFQY